VIPSEKRRRDVVAVSLGLLCGVGRHHPIAAGIDDQACQQARRLRAHRQRALLPIGRELVLLDLPKLRIDDGLVLARVGCALVNDFAPIEPVLEHQVEGAAGAAGFEGTTFRMSGARRVATRKASMIARNASAKASIEASR
jgi:hypothetical protein